MKKSEPKLRYVRQADAKSTNHLDLRKMETARFPNLKPSTTTISLRLPDSLLNNLKALANKQDVAYQSLIKIILAEKLTSRSFCTALESNQQPSD